jgi:catechol 2,3-dioxygenase-like lactoylglutathione lyase family enzyme
MSAPGKLIGFIPVTDAERATAFYRDTLGLEFVKDDGFALVFRSAPVPNEAGNMVRLARMPAVTPAPFTILGWETTSIESDVKALTAKGVVFTRYNFLQQDELGIWTAPGGDKVAWFTDPDGNVLSLSQHVG